VIVLSRDDVEALLDVDALIDGLADAMAELSGGRASVPERTAVLLPGTGSMLVDMPGASAGAVMSKLVSVFPGNAGGPTPVRQAVIVAFDPENGEPAALLDGTYITAIRTAACAALSVRLLAREDAEVLAVLGTGPQAAAHVQAVSRVRPFREVRVAGRDFERTAAFVKGLPSDVPVRAVTGYAEALDGADVVSAATYAVDPVVRREWLTDGAHITSVGYNPQGREIDDATIADADVFVEARKAALEAVPPNRDLADALANGLISADSVTELGEIVTAKPRRAKPLSLYKSVGSIVQDAAATSLVLRAAREQGRGREVSL